MLSPLWNRRWVAATCLLAAASLLLTGCGGGGASGVSSGSSNLNVFLTDNLSDAYSSVWVNLHKVTLVKSDDTTVDIFTSAEGVQTDLRSLNDGQAKYLFLTSASIPAGTYKGARIEMDKDLVLVATGSTTGQQVQFADAFDSPTAGQSVVPVAFNPAKSFNPGDSLPLDFVLDQWNLVSGKVTPVVHKGEGAGLESHDRHVDCDMHGTVASLTGEAPNQSFRMTLFGGPGVPVSTSPETTIIAPEGSTSTTLANGENVSMKGKWNPATKSFDAAWIKIEDPADSQLLGAFGASANVVPGSGTFDVMAVGTRGFLPTSNQIHCVVGEGAVFKSDAGVSLDQAAFFAILQQHPGCKVAVTGTQDTGENTIRVKFAKLDNDVHLGLAHAKGSVVSFDGGAGKLVLHLLEWEGFSWNANENVDLTCESDTLYWDASNNQMTKDQFFALLNAGSKVFFETKLMDDGLHTRSLRLLADN